MKFAEVQELELPPGYTWGAWSGDYLQIERSGRVWGSFGGLVVAVAATRDGLQRELNRYIVKRQQELERV